MAQKKIKPLDAPVHILGAVKGFPTTGMSLLFLFVGFISVLLSCIEGCAKNSGPDGVSTTTMHCSNTVRARTFKGGSKS